MKRLLPLLLLTPTTAFSHAGDHSQSSILHLIREPDHLVVLGLVFAAVVVGLVKLAARR